MKIIYYASFFYLLCISLSIFSAESRNIKPFHDLQHVPLWAVYQIHGSIIAPEFKEPTVTEDELFCIAYLHCMACAKDKQRTHVRFDIERSLRNCKPGGDVKIRLFENQPEYNLVYYRDLYTAALKDIHTGWELDKNDCNAFHLVLRKKQNDKHEHSVISHLITLMHLNDYIKVWRVGKIEDMDITLTIKKKNLSLVLEKFNIFPNIIFEE